MTVEKGTNYNMKENRIKKEKTNNIDSRKEIEEEFLLGEYEKNVKDKCGICRKTLVVSLERYMENGNFCDKCSAGCTKSSRKKATKFTNKRFKNKVTVECTGDCINCKNIECLSNCNIRLQREQK